MESIPAKKATNTPSRLVVQRTTGLSPGRLALGHVKESTRTPDAA